MSTCSIIYFSKIDPAIQKKKKNNALPTRNGEEARNRVTVIALGLFSELGHVNMSLPLLLG
jgi:hypothetical protein